MLKQISTMMMKKRKTLAQKNWKTKEHWIKKKRAFIKVKKDKID